MTINQPIASEAFALSTDLLSDLELNRMQLSNCMMKAARLARLIGDDTHLSIFQYELSGYPSEPSGVPVETWRLLRIARRIKLREEGDEKKVKENVERADVRSIVSIEENADTLRLRLSFFQPQPVSISSSNPNQFVSAPFRDMQAEARIATAYNNEKSLLSERKSFLYSYVLDRYFELRVSSPVNNVFEKYRRKIDSLLGDIIPAELRRLDSIESNLISSNPEDWANAAHSCRRLLQAIADVVYPPSDANVTSATGKEIKTGKDNYINRLVLFCETKIRSNVSSKIIGSDLKSIGERLDACFSAAQKGSHADIEQSEAERFVLHTYFLIGDIIELNVEQSNPSLEKLS